MRGKGIFPTNFLSYIGITPACAGKSDSGDQTDLVYEDHPRVCGEKQEHRDESYGILGSPPRVRGKGV